MLEIELIRLFKLEKSIVYTQWIGIYLKIEFYNCIYVNTIDYLHLRIAFVAIEFWYLPMIFYSQSPDGYNK